MQFGHHFWGMHLFWWLFWIVVVAALLLWPWQGRRETAIEMLRRRYAAGEITDEEYRQRLGVLDSGASRDGGTGAAA